MLFLCFHQHLKNEGTHETRTASRTRNEAFGVFRPTTNARQNRMDVVFTEGPRISVRPLSDARFGSLKAVLGVDDEMQQVM